MQIGIISGSRSETPAEKGSATVLAKSAFQGTQKLSGLKLMRTLETLGVVVSSRSDRDKIVYELKSLPDKLSAAFEALSETIKKPSKPLYMVGYIIWEHSK